MKTYKKRISMALASLMLLSVMATSALAVDPAAEAARKEADIDASEANAEDRQASIDVLAFQDELVVYAVDVEWGEMTFQYVPGTWNPETMKLTGAGAWKVYDRAREGNEAALAETEVAINKITVKNRSNAPVSASLAYSNASETTYGVSAGEFTNTTASNTTTVNYKDDHTAFLLAKATPGVDASDGTAAEGAVYFMPTTAPSENLTTAKFTKIGAITVTVATSATAPENDTPYSPA